MKAYMEVKDILARTLYGTIADFTMEFDCTKDFPREVMDAEPTDFCVSDNCLTIKICKDED